MQMKIYEKPRLTTMPVHWAKWPKLAQRDIRDTLALPWVKAVKEEFFASKSVVIDAPVEAVWKVVANPANASVYLDSVVSVEKTRDKRYKIKEVATPKLNRSWEIIEYEMEVLECKEEKSHIFRIHFDDKRAEQFGYRLEPNGKGQTVLSYETKTNFSVSNYDEMGRMTDRMLMKIGKMAMGDQSFKKSLS